MTVSKLILYALLAFTFAPMNAFACDEYKAKQIAEKALMKKDLSCFPGDGAKKCFLHVRPAEIYKGNENLMAVPFFSVTDTGLLAAFGNVLIRKNCDVQFIQESGAYLKPIRTSRASGEHPTTEEPADETGANSAQ
ncbi:MAG: hypothetical protein AB7K68_15845 [Bacteriovoracia bacterium]